jgi:hypothetical protein
MIRTGIAFLLFPIPAALARALVVWRWPSPLGGVFAHPASMFVAMCLFIYLLELVLGAPILLGMRRRGRETLVDYAVAGLALLAIPTSLAIVCLVVIHQFAWINLLAIFVAAACGIVGGAFFWGLARPRGRNYGGVFD